MCIHAGAPSTLNECESVLSQLVTYNASNDIAEQRQALIEFYQSTGGADWSSETLSTATITELQTFEAYLSQLGLLSASPTFNLSSLPTTVQQLYEVLSELSVNCTLQRQLQLVNLLIKYPWNTDGMQTSCNLQPANETSWQRVQHHSRCQKNNLACAGVSYCSWYGVACCQTAGDFFSQYCSQGAQSVAQIFLTGKASLFHL